MACLGVHDGAELSRPSQRESCPVALGAGILILVSGSILDGEEQWLRFTATAIRFSEHTFGGHSWRELGVLRRIYDELAGLVCCCL